MIVYKGTIPPILSTYSYLFAVATGAKKTLTLPENSRSVSTTADKKEGKSGLAPPPCQVLLRSDACMGLPKVATLESTSFVTDAGGWIWDPFLGHSAKHVKPMCH